MPGTNRLEEMASLSGAGSENVNPLKSDPELQMLLKKLNSIKKYKKFQGWKSQFLSRLEQFLYQEGMVPAETACNDFDKLLTKFVKSANKVQDCIDNGQLNDSKKTVRASLALNEMCNSLTVVNSETESLVPGRSQEERKLGFTKFHLGAALIRQGFHQYITMKAIEDALEKIGQEITHVMDRQQHDLFLAYRKQVRRFCDVMADLNLYEVMMKCLQFAEEPEDESEDPEPIRIVIKASNGNTLRLELDPTETIGNVKDAIEAGCGIAADRQVLKFHGSELGDNAKTLMELDIVDHSTLTVEPLKVLITINNIMDGTQIKIMIDPAGKLSEIKQQLEVESGLSPENQRLLMNGLELVDDNNTAEFYGIRTGSILDLEPKSIKVSVRMPDGKMHEMVINPADTTESIKDKIEHDTGMVAARQVLKCENKELTDGKTVKDMGLKDGTLIQVGVFKVPITVTTVDGKQIKVMIDPTEKLGSIKDQLVEESGIPSENQKLSMNDEELADDDKTAAEYGIESGSELALEPKLIKLSVEMPDGKSYLVDVKPFDTTDVIKVKIEKETGMAVPRQVLKSEGRKLPSGKTVKDMGLKDGTPIQVEVHKVPITVRTMDGKQIKVMIDPTEKLGSIKDQLVEESGIPSENQKLSMNDEELADDDKTAAEYGIESGSELALEPKLIKLSVEMPDGKTYLVDVKPSDTTDGIKVKIEKETGMAVPRQVLKSEGRKLPSGKTVKDMGLTDGSPIQVEVHKVPITVRTMDGKQIKMMIDPTDKLGSIKDQLVEESGIPSENQNFFLKGHELANNKTATECGVKAGSELDLEPKLIKVSIEIPDGNIHTIEVAPSDVLDEVKAKITKATGIAAPRQVLTFQGKELPGGNKTVRDMGLRQESSIKLDIFKIPITVKTRDGKSVSLQVEPSESIDTIKKMLQKQTGIEVPKQCLKFRDEELKNGRSTVEECGIQSGSVLTVEPHLDPIIFVDIKCGTLFAVDREDVIEREVLTLKDEHNKLDFVQAAADSAAREKILKHMLDSPRLGVATQVVVKQTDVEDYDLEEAEKVKNVWGVKLKKREKNKKGEEFIFVDPKTGATGELSRQKYIDSKFITPRASGKGETLEETEKDAQLYDKYIFDIRNVFGVKSAN